MVTLSERTYLTVDETAEYLRLKTSTIYNYVHKSKIAHYKMGSRVFFKVEDLDEFVDENYKPVIA